jgi:hypothetical protein
MRPGARYLSLRPELSPTRTGTSVPAQPSGGDMSIHHARPQSGRAETAGAQAQRGVVVIAASMTLAMAVLSAFLTMSTGRNGTQADVGVGVAAFLLFVAASAVGAALGFLFGLPRARFTDQLASSDASASEKPPAGSHYLANSNLIKVSDWLTTIVIGLGLVNLGSAVPALRSLGGALQQALGGAPYAGAVGVSALIAGCIGGFVLVYVYTTIRVRQLLEDSDRQTERVPHLSGLTLGEAEAAMSSTGLRLAVDADAAKHVVVAAQQPPPGERLPLGSAVAVQLAATRASTSAATTVAVPVQQQPSQS